MKSQIAPTAALEVRPAEVSPGDSRTQANESQHSHGPDTVTTLVPVEGSLRRSQHPCTRYVEHNTIGSTDETGHNFEDNVQILTCHLQPPTVSLTGHSRFNHVFTSSHPNHFICPISLLTQSSISVSLLTQPTGPSSPGSLWHAP